jgi:hypothetical protein
MSSLFSFSGEPSASSLLTDKGSEYKTYFISYFMECLDVEYRYLEDVAAGHHQSRLAERDQYLSMLMSAISMTGGAALSSVGVGGANCIIEAFVHMAKRRIQQNANQKSSDQLAGMVPVLNRVQRETVYQLISTEMWYRYGPAVFNFMFKRNLQLEATLLLKAITRIGAIRVLFNAMSNGIWLTATNVPTLVDGIFDAFSSFPEKTKLQQLLKGELIMGKSKLSIQGLYTEGALLEPGLTVWNREEPGNTDSVAVEQLEQHPTAKSGFLFGRKKKSTKTSSSADGTDQFPNGLICVPAGHQQPDDYVHFNVTKSECELFGVDICLKFNHRYVGFHHIVDYLVSMKGVADPLSFGVWLCENPKYSSEFKSVNVAEFIPIYRGRIDGTVLALKGADFADGVFDRCDLSYCILFKLTIKSMKQCNVYGTELCDCSIVGPAMNNSLLSMCRIVQCSFQQVRGVLSLKYCSLIKSSFAEARLHLSWDGK